MFIKPTKMEQWNAIESWKAYKVQRSILEYSVFKDWNSGHCTLDDTYDKVFQLSTNFTGF